MPASAMSIEPLSKKFGHGERIAAPQITAKKQGTDNITDAVNGHHDHQRADIAFVDKAGFTEKCIGTEKARHQCADDKQRRCASAGYIVIIQVFDLAAGVAAYGEITEDAADNAYGINIHDANRPTIIAFIVCMFPPTGQVALFNRFPLESSL